MLLKDLQDQSVFKDFQDLLVRHHPLVRKEPQGPKVLVDQLDDLDLMERKVQLAQWVFPDLLDHKVSQVRSEQQDFKVLKALPAPLELEAHADKSEKQDPRDHKEFKVHQGLVEVLELQDHKDHKG